MADGDSSMVTTDSGTDSDTPGGDGPAITGPFVVQFDPDLHDPAVKYTLTGFSESYNQTTGEYDTVGDPTIRNCVLWVDDLLSIEDGDLQRWLDRQRNRKYRGQLIGIELNGEVVQAADLHDSWGFVDTVTTDDYGSGRVFGIGFTDDTTGLAT